jgi:murein L,D-transpeptidase YafK
MILGCAFNMKSVALALALLSIAVFTGLPFNHAAAADQADQIVIFKSKRVLLLLREGRVLDRWRISLGEHPIGPKREEGDGRTPEGVYVIDARILNTRFHHSLHLSYPNASDMEYAQLVHDSPGSNIAIHGLPDDYHPVRGQRPGDWTDGCIALDNHAIDVLWRLVDVGTPVTIFP